MDPKHIMDLKALKVSGSRSGAHRPPLLTLSNPKDPYHQRIIHVRLSVRCLEPTPGKDRDGIEGLRTIQTRIYGGEKLILLQLSSLDFFSLEEETKSCAELAEAC